MNELLRGRLIGLLSEPTQVTNEEMQTAYGCFMEQVRTVSQLQDKNKKQSSIGAKAKNPYLCR